MSIVTELSKLRGEHTVLADVIRGKYADFKVLQADKSAVDQLDKAHKSLEKSVNAWDVARNAALKGDLEGAEQAVAESRRLLTEADETLPKNGTVPKPASSSDHTSPVTSSSEPAPAPSAPDTSAKPQGTKEKQSAPAGQAKKDESKPTSYGDAEIRQMIHDIVGQKFEEIDNRFNNAESISEEIKALFADGKYTVADLERMLRVGHWYNQKLRKDRHHKKDDKEHDTEHSPGKQDERSDPPTKVHNLGADQKAAPQHERK